ncbi:GNAT family N-acetyltransferase [Streptomyces sp. NBC_00237]|uniref:GNAT family N-acetyltransferase n=1 Tax=Streptomyces sp. NBC_00237 TaxID=2975687 RepID=UPI002257A65A|nr:GNAT family N-acetyltransferase [Streptomyces sp. NBC_00237]MCX5205153.1 GNAT family N-acetyltransferase [Streptomyces sp. NBC_00237]
MNSPLNSPVNPPGDTPVDTPVDIRELHELDAFDAVAALFEKVWGAAPGDSPVNPELMRAFSHSGNYVAGAYEHGTLIGASVGFFAAPSGQTLHSHVTGALPGRAAGLALKLHQREWSLARGLTRITWTYDPLVRRNAHFNLSKLGARPVEYLPCFYGEMADAINGGDESDRALMSWDLAAHPAPAVTVPADAVTVLSVRDGLPAPGRDLGAATLLVEIPPDIEGLRRTDPAAAKEWRLALREVLGGLLADGARVTGFHDRTCYVVERATLTSR